MRLSTPRHLGTDGKRFYRTVIAQFDLKDDERALHFLEIAAVQFERMKSAERAISEQGSTIKDRYGGQKLNPMLAVETRARREHITALREALKEAQQTKRIPIAQRRAKLAKDASNVETLSLVKSIIRGS
jgi:hypothetical protein